MCILSFIPIFSFKTIKCSNNVCLGSKPEPSWEIFSIEAEFEVPLSQWGTNNLWETVLEQSFTTDPSLLNFTKPDFGLYQWKHKGSKEHSLHH